VKDWRETLIQSKDVSVFFWFNIFHVIQINYLRETTIYSWVKHVISREGQSFYNCSLFLWCLRGHSLYSY